MYHILLYIALTCRTSTISLTINNAGFESDTMPNGSPIPHQTFVYGSPIITDWIPYDPHSLMNTESIGISNPTNSGQYTSNSAPQGNQNAWLWIEDKIGQGEIGIVQQLSDIVTINTQYTLTVTVGNPGKNSQWSNESTGTGPNGETFSNQDGFPGYRIELLAGNSTLALDNNTISIEDGQWKQSIITVNVTDSNPYIGQLLSIRLVNLNQANGDEVGFDWVKLNAISLSPSNYTSIYVATRCFSTQQIDYNRFFYPPYDGIIHGAILKHINGTQRCGNAPPSNIYDNFGCAYDNNIFTESLLHLFNGTRELWYPTGNATDGYTGINKGNDWWIEDAAKGNCTTNNCGGYVWFKSPETLRNGSELTWINPLYAVTTNTQLLVADIDTCCHWSTFDNDGVICVDVNLLYHKFFATSIWSDDFLSIYIDIEWGNQVVLNMDSLSDDCLNIFDSHMLNIIGGNGAVCQWIIDSNNDEFDIQIDLSANAKINLINNSLMIKAGAFLYTLNQHSNVPNVPIHVSIDEPINVSNPDIIIDIPTQIGSCDDLLLDARATMNLGGRDGIFIWNIYELQFKWYGDMVTIPNANLSNLNGDILIGLSVYSWFGGVSHLNITIHKSLLEVIPNINLNGINEYSSNNDKLLNGRIDIYSSIVFRDNCNNKESVINQNNYEIIWFVKASNRNIND
eukprot:107460_1